MASNPAKSQHLCVHNRCKNLREPGKARCWVHLGWAARHSATYRQRRESQGLCHHSACKKRPVKDRRFCKAHLKLHAEKTNEYLKRKAKERERLNADIARVMAQSSIALSRLAPSERSERSPRASRFLASPLASEASDRLAPRASRLLQARRSEKERGARRKAQGATSPSARRGKAKTEREGARRKAQGATSPSARRGKAKTKTAAKKKASR